MFRPFILYHVRIGRGENGRSVDVTKIKVKLKFFKAHNRKTPKIPKMSNLHF